MSNSLYSKILMNSVVNNVIEYKVVHIPPVILNMIKELASTLPIYNIAFYFGDSYTPFLVKGSELYDSRGNLHVINTLEDIGNYISMGGSIVINNDIRLTMSNYMYVIHNIKDKDIYIPLLHLYLTYIESYLLLTEHVESDIVYRDVLNISDDIVLTNDCCIKYNTISAYIADTHNERYDYSTNSLIETIYHKLYNFILEYWDIDSYNMYTLSLKGINLLISTLPPPSSIRYSINAKIYKDTKYEMEPNEYDTTNDLPY